MSDLTNSREVLLMNKTLVILAAGIGSRFGGGIKQLETIDDNGHIIMDYSIHDAISAGFDRIVFIIRHDIESDFRNVIGDRIEREVGPLGVEIAYAFQEMTNIPGIVPEGRTKPWGTGHAILACDGLLEGPFAVINADDYYGKNGFVKASEFLGKGYGLVGFILGNTLSDNGSVTRGICSVKDSKLVGINETRNIIKTQNGVEVNGQSVDADSLVSMNFWCYPIEFVNVLKRGFPEFLTNMENPLTDEFLLPIIADGMLKEGVEFTVLPTSDQWFGVTYQEDKQTVVDSFRKLIESGVYHNNLYSDLHV